MKRALVVVILLSGCDTVFDLDPVDRPADAGPDTFARDPVAGLPFSAPVLIAELQTSSEEDDPSLTADLRELYLYGGTNIFRSTRASPADIWSTPSLVTELDSTLTNFRPSVSSDGLTLYFTRRSPAEPRDDIYVTTRPNRGVAWGTPVPLPGNVNTNDNEIGGWTSDDGLTLVFESHAAGGQHDLFFARRDDVNAPFMRAEPLDFANTNADESGGWFNAARTIFVFDSNRIGSSTSVWEAYRDGETWVVVAHPELDSAYSDGTPWLSPDGRTIIFSSTRSVTNDDLYMATR